MKTLAQEVAQLEQQKHRELLQRNRALKAKQQEDDRRKFIVGEIFLSVFPEYKELRPQQTKEETELEFMMLKYFLDDLATRRVLVEAIQKVSARRARSRSSSSSALMNPKREVVK